MRRLFIVALFAAASLSLTAACNKGSSGYGAPGDSGKPVKRACKMQGKCYLCPDDAAMQKCILNPATSGCKQASDSDCEM